MAKKIRKQTYSLSSYLRDVKDEDIRSDQDVQRMSGAWDNSTINELIYTVLTDDYILPIILGEEEKEDGTQLWIVDGLQRTTSLIKFRYGNYKITNSIENSEITYQKKVLDETGKAIKDENDDFVLETKTFNIRNKTYDMLPDELKKRFNGYQIETAIHQNCTMLQLSRLVRLYNAHKSMNASQKAFTYIPSFARRIKDIVNNDFFKNCTVLTEKDKTNGVHERIVCESVMAMFHLNHWANRTKQLVQYLDNNASNEEFETLIKNINILSTFITKDEKSVFTSKDTFIWLAAFNYFLSLNIPNDKFKDFIRDFKTDLHNKEVSGDGFSYVKFDDVDKNKSTKAKKVVTLRFEVLKKLMDEYFGIEEKESEKEVLIENNENNKDTTEISIDFIKNNIQVDVSKDDLEFYENVLNDLTVNVDNNSLLLHPANHLSLLALTIYACNRDIDLDSWIVHFFKNNNAFKENQSENYIYMKDDLQNYLLHKEVV